MQLRKATTFIASIAIFLPLNSNASLLRGDDREVDRGDTLEITEDRPGTFLKASVDYEDSIHDGPDETFNIMIEDSIYEIDDVDEELKKIKSGEAITIPKGVILEAKSGKAQTNGAKIKPSKEDKKSKKKEKEDKDSKKEKKKENLFDRNLEGRTEEQQRNVDQLRRHLASTGDKTVVAVRVQATDAVYSHSEEDLRREVFGIGGTDTFNLASGYDQCSYGSLTFNPLASHSSNGVSIENGVVTISVDVAAGGEENSVVRNAVTNKIKEIFGFSSNNDMKSVADYWMYCLPPGTNGGWIAYAYINHYISVYNNNWCNYPSGQMHEIGHNLGYAHSGEGSTYDDQSGMMGFSYSQDDGPVMCFNAAKSWQTGWYGPAGAHGDKTLEYSSGDGCLVQTLSGIADYDTTPNKVLVKVVNPDPNNSGKDIFVAFNAKKGINSGTKEAGNQVTVVQVEGGGGSGYFESNLLSKLSAGGTYTSSDFGDQPLKVEVDSISGSDSADIKIYFGSECAVTPPPVPTNPPTPLPTTPPSSPPTSNPTSPPTAQPTKAGQSGPQVASFDTGLGAPRCSFGSSCDSEGLLDGRGTITNGIEPNQSNSLNSCTDGGGGTYHSDESIDKIVVTRSDGGGNDMTEGDEVTISADIWCWNTGTQDFIDFYYASDAANPVWTQIGARQQCPGGGAQTVTASYTLPEGGVQAVRVNMMYDGSSTVTAASCTNGSWDDTDDVVISVKAANQQTAAPTQNPTPQPSNAPTPVPSSPPTTQPTSIPTSLPTPQPSNTPTTASPTKSPTQLPTPVPTNPPTAPPTSNPTSNPTPIPTSLPTPQPSNTPTTASPTKSPSQPPTPVPTNPPTPVPSSPPTQPPIPAPTNPPTSPPTSNPTSNPTPQPSNPPTPVPSNPPTTSPPTKAPIVAPPPTSAPSKSPTPLPTQQPTDAPTNNPTAQPTALPTAPPTSPPEMTKTLVCGRGDIEDKPCAEGLKGTASIDEMHEVRCCRDCTDISCSKPWKRKCSTFEPNLFARSKIGECKVGTFAEAIDFCRKATNDGRSRLCTPLEVENSCAKGTGCQFDKQQVWTCAYDGHTCQADAECCGTCVNGTCQGESSLFP